MDDSAGASVPSQALSHYNKLLELMDNLGMQAALNKCQHPLTTLTWIGVDFNSVTMIMSISRDKILEAIALCKQFLASRLSHLS